MVDLCLRFNNDSEATDILYNKEITHSATTKFRNIDVIGTIFRDTGELDSDGIPVISEITGWHVNVKVMEDEDASILEPYIVYPTNRVRVWAA